jgi:CheY-like chemotaxis protein
MAFSRHTGLTGLENVTVLLVDDSRSMRDLMKTILRELGVQRIDEAGSGAEGLEWLHEGKYDIVFVDWMMEPIDGWEFVRFVRNSIDSPNRYIPIIMITGHSEAHRVRAARDIGVTEFLVKPVSAKAVAQRLEAVIHHPRPFVRTQTFFGPDRRRRVASFDGFDRRRGKNDKPIVSKEEIETMLQKDPPK